MLFILVSWYTSGVKIFEICFKILVTECLHLTMMAMVGLRQSACAAMWLRWRQIAGVSTLTSDDVSVCWLESSQVLEYTVV